MSGFVSSLLHGVPSWVVYLAVFGFPFLEASVFLGFVFPGETALVLGGVLASQGRASLTACICWAVAGAVTGDSVGYYVGQRFGPALQSSRLGQRVGDSRWATADSFLQRRGGPAVLVGRLTALLRALVPTAAGMSSLRYRTFAVWNVVGGLLWGGGFVLVGYLAGSSYKVVERALGRGLLIATGVLVLGLLVVHHLRRRRRRLPAAESGAEDADGGGPRRR